MEEMPRSRHDRTWAGFTGAVAGAAVLSPFLAASAVARELLRPDPSDTDINRQLTRLANDSFDLHAEAQRIAATISFPTAQEFLQLIFEGCIDRLLAENRLFPPGSKFDANADVVLALYDLPELSIPPEKPLDILLHTIDGARWRDATRYYIAQFSNPQLMLRLTSTAFFRSFYEFICALPPTTLISSDEFSRESDDDSPPPSFTVPFADVGGHPGSLIMTLLLPFYAPDILEHDLFVRLRTYINERSESTGSMPEDYHGTPEEVVEAYLSNTPFERLFKAAVPLRLPDEQRFSGHWIIAPSGRGKTTLLHKLFLEDIGREASVIVMDSKGDLSIPSKSYRPSRIGSSSSSLILIIRSRSIRSTFRKRISPTPSRFSNIFSAHFSKRR